MNYNRSLKFLPAVLLLTCFSCRPVAQLPVQESLLWLEGVWLGQDGNSGETWNYIASEDRMEGIAWTLTDGDTTTTELMQLLYRRDKLFYMAQPEGQGPVYFEVKQQGPEFFSADNPFHDFPKTIEYQREGNQLSATISSEDRKMEFSFKHQ